MTILRTHQWMKMETLFPGRGRIEWAGRFGSLLRGLRVDSGKSMGDLARHLQITVTFLSNIERGIVLPLFFTPEVIDRTADFLGLSSADRAALKRSGEGEHP